MYLLREEESFVMRFITSLKKRIYKIIEVADPQDFFSKIFDIFILNLILVNVVISILDTVQKLSSTYDVFFSLLEKISVVIFTFEYLLRIWTITLKPEFNKPVLGRLKYAFTFLSIVDLLAIVPYYIPMLITVDLRFLRALRLFRIFRLLKLERYTKGLQVIGEVVKDKKAELIITFFLLTLTILISASLVYFVEVSVQPDKFTSIPYAIWWSVAAVTSVGYGDVYPITPVGQILGSFTALCGVVLFALPAAILTSGFNEVLKKEREEDTRSICPHCNREI